MSKKKKIIVSISVAVFVFLAFFTWGLVEIIPFSVKVDTEQWQPTDEYSVEKTAVLQKQKDKDFVILNLTDIQVNDTLDIGKKELTYNTITKLVEQTKPDLITVTGDTVWALFAKHSLTEIVNFIDSFNIPWAPVMGNHEGDWSNVSREYAGKKFDDAKNCLFSFGPNNVSGVGNYIVNIMEDNKIVNSLIMMDSHSSTKGEYDFIRYDQIAWYRWAIKGAQKFNNDGKVVQSAVFMHIPLRQYMDAWEEYKNSNFDPAIGFGENNEKVSCSPYENGFFDVIKELDSTKNVIAGHDHVNNFSVLYQGVRLTYALKTGDRCYARDYLNGGTLLTVRTDGTMLVEHKYILL